MKALDKWYRYSIVLCLTCFISFTLTAQRNDSIIIDSYIKHIKIPREVAYLHLNKSTFIKGEQIGFTAYLLDKRTQLPTRLSTNLYVSIEDSSKTILDQKMLKINNGTVANIFALDSNYTSGYYTIKAFTSWMRNFNEQDYFIEIVRVIDPRKEEYIESEIIDSAIDAQFLPESGHLLSNVENTISVIIKDKKGYGIPNLRGKVYDKDHNLITEFKVNHLGIGRFKLLPQQNDDYLVEINFLNKDFHFRIDHNIEPVGIVLSVVQTGNKAYAILKTNERSQDILKDNLYKLYLHNQNGITPIDISFKASQSITRVFDLTKIPKGINALTLFDKNGNPILERIFFNYHNLVLHQTASTTAKKEQDSITINLSFDHISAKRAHNISISVLPEATESYNRNTNIVSYNLLEPYVKGVVEQPSYYFTDVNRKTKFELDNLLLTQGWSSYDWSEIFASKTLQYPVENGITVKANINKGDTKNTEAYMFQHGNGHAPLIIKPNANEKSFIVNNIFLSDDQSIYISEIRKNASMGIPKLYLQGFPDKVPTFNHKTFTLRPKHNYKSFANLNNNSVSTESTDKEQKLDEVVVTGELNRSRTRIRAQELQTGSFGTVKVITDEERKVYWSLEDYINAQGVSVLRNRADFGDDPDTDPDVNAGIRFYTGRSISTNKVLFMDIFINDVYIGNTLAPNAFPMNTIDYIEINKSGLGSGAGQGFKGTGGVIRIYTNPKEVTGFSNRKQGQKYDLPLKFSRNKKFYVPKYIDDSNDFFKQYGTIDWKPQLISDDNGMISVKIRAPKVPVTLFIEGIANDGSFIFEKESISLN